MKNCLEFAEILGTITQEQKEAKKTVERYFEERTAAKQEEMKKRSTTLAAFMPEEIKKMSFSQLLDTFMDEGRMRRARGISNREVNMREISDNRVTATVREYNVVFDLQKRTILHDCADWSRCIPAKQFCKHIGKVLLTLPQGKATSILRQVSLEREKWDFKPYATEA